MPVRTVTKVPMKELSENTVVGKKLRQGKDRFQAFSVPCDNSNDVPGIISQLTSGHRLHKASHITWAHRLKCSGSIREMKNDGGESGAGNCILEIMRKKNTVNTLVLIARWYGGRHLGLRFLPV